MNGLEHRTVKQISALVNEAEDLIKSEFHSNLGNISDKVTKAKKLLFESVTLLKEVLQNQEDKK